MTPYTNTAILLAALASQALAVNNGLARTPQMGWNNWNSLGCDVSESLLLATANNLVSLGLRDVGYNYVVLDDCWQDGRDENRKVKVNLEQFPHGMKWVSDQIHSQNLLYGMYSSAGEMTCARFEGSLDYETEDAESYASWGVDYLKYDNCYALGRVGTAEVSFNRYNTMAKALNATGRPILYSLCQWGEDFVNSWGFSIANSYRISGDIYDSFARPNDLCSCTSVDPASPYCVAPGSKCSVLTILNRIAPYVDRGQPGGWQDMDMLEVGIGGMTDEEYKAHFALWAALKSPLLIGADIRDLSPAALTILNNPAIIVLSQDPLGRPASRVLRNTDVPKDRFGIGETQVWSGPLYGGDQVVVLLNVANTDQEMTVELEDIFLGEGPACSALQCSEAWDIHDLWATRMDETTAKKIIAQQQATNTAGVAKIYKDENLYNATDLSYKDGLERGDSRLLGEKIGEVKAFGSLTVTVPRHAAKVFRLRSQSGAKSKRYGTTKDEL